jgi:four helix bundle protein
VRAVRVEDLPVFQRAVAFRAAIFALTQSFACDSWLADQLGDSAESIAANIAEGFRQPSDRAFARYLGISSSSAEEARTHLGAAESRGHVGRERRIELSAEATEIADMLDGFIRYLRRCDRKDRYRR